MRESARRNAPLSSKVRTTFRITHPFHPLFPGEYNILELRRDWGHNLVAFYDEKGSTVTIPISWTDLDDECDLFLVLSQGRAYFRVVDLLHLSELIETIKICKNDK